MIKKNKSDLFLQINVIYIYSGAKKYLVSHQGFSMGLRSEDWLGHSRTLKCFLRSHSFVARAVCLGSLSCWKTQPRFIFNALADGRRFDLKISWYMAPFILSFTQISRPGPFAEKQPQSMMFPPPCFTVGMVFFGCNSAFFLLQTQQVESGNVFHFLIIAPTVDFFTPSCLPIADSVFPAWCRSTILFLVSFDSSWP